MQSDTRFTAPWGPRLAIMTAVGLLAFAGPAAMLVFVGLQRDWMQFLLMTSIALGVAIFLRFIARVYFIRGYVVSRDGITVERLGDDLRLDLTDLQSLEVDPRAMSWTYMMPNGGLFSLGGKRCRNPRLGLYEAYATDPSRSVVLRFPKRTVVLTPDDPEGFAQAIEAVQTATDRACTTT